MSGYCAAYLHHRSSHRPHQGISDEIPGARSGTQVLAIATNTTLALADMSDWAVAVSSMKANLWRSNPGPSFRTLRLRARNARYVSSSDTVFTRGANSHVLQAPLRTRMPMPTPIGS